MTNQNLTVVQTSNQYADDLKQMSELEAALNSRFFERKQIISVALDSMIAGTHMMLLGDPGTAKSAVTNAIAEAFDCTYFHNLMSRFTTPDELFGPLDPKLLTESGNLFRKAAGYLPEAEIAFLDEVFKGSSAINNALLTIANERVWRNDGKIVRSPLRFIMAASNEIPSDEDGLEAFFDRFLSRFWVESIQDDINMSALLFGGATPLPMPKLDFSILDRLRQKADQVTFSQQAQSAILEVRTECTARNVKVSDRRWVSIRRLLQAHVCRKGKTEVTTADFAPLENTLWNKPEQRSIVGEICAQFAASWVTEIQAIASVIDEQSPRLQQCFKKASTRAEKMACFSKVMAALEPEEIKLKELIKDTPDCKTEAESLLNRIGDLFDNGRKAMMGLGA